MLPVREVTLFFLYLFCKEQAEEKGQISYIPNIRNELKPCFDTKKDKNDAV